jgi:hypothetical protein
VRLWAVSDGVRVKPVTGRLLEDRTAIHKDYPTGDYRARNAVWDAATLTVSLQAARNEFVAFQLVLEAGQPVARADSLRADDTRAWLQEAAKDLRRVDILLAVQPA